MVAAAFFLGGAVEALTDGVHFGGFSGAFG